MSTNNVCLFVEKYQYFSVEKDGSCGAMYIPYLPQVFGLIGLSTRWRLRVWHLIWVCIVCNSSSSFYADQQVVQ